jgi:hypothetical protein
MMFSGHFLLGNLERTLLHRFCMRQNLRALFNTQQLPNELHPIITQYDKAFNSDIRGTLLHDNHAFNDALNSGKDDDTFNQINLTSLPKQHYKLLQKWVREHDDKSPERSIPNQVSFLSTFRRFGQVYQTADSSPRDSYVLYKDVSSTISAGRIQDMFMHSRTSANKTDKQQTFFVINPYQHLSSDHEKFDPYRQFPANAGQMYYDKFYTKPVIVSCDEVLCHFVCTPEHIAGINEMCIHVLPLDKVCV